MGPNEFTVQDDRIGFLDDGGELNKFLTFESSEEETSEADPKSVRFD